MAALTRMAIRQRVFIGSQIHHHPFTAELDSFRLCVVTDNLNRENPRATGPFLHSLVRFESETARGIIPTEANPNCLGVRAVAVAKALAVVIVKRERAVRTGMDPECGWLGH